MEGDQTVITPPASGGTLAKESGNSPVQLRRSHDQAPKVFKFDQSYWSFDKKDPQYAGQDRLFSDLGQDLLKKTFDGYNTCIFAYGQTGSGKSYSMMGYGEEKGIIPRICTGIFTRIDDFAEEDTSYTVEVSYMEIYNEKVRDLLNPKNKGHLRVREHPSYGPYVEDLSKLLVSSFEEIESLMDEGNKARTVAATAMNETSSRSHAVFTLILTQRRMVSATETSGEKVAKISLVDLAGSERANSTGATGARLKEGAEINRSLSTLGRVIQALATSQELHNRKRKISIPYRDSILTWLLKDSLGGNSMTAMIAAISPAEINYEETLSTLRYADSAKRIKNHAVVNEEPNSKMIRELREELTILRNRMQSGEIADSLDLENTDIPLERQMVNIVAADGSSTRVSKAEIAERMEQSTKLIEDLNQTWEQKLEKTHIIQKEREAALEELGIYIEKGLVGISTPKKLPHLVNLSDDPLLAECLVYNIKPGITRVGNIESQDSDIRLSGTSIKAEHCLFRNENGIVVLESQEGANVMVNGIRLTYMGGPKTLHSGYRVIIGDFHIFRFNHPEEARAERALKQQSSIGHFDSQLSDTPSTPTRLAYRAHELRNDFHELLYDGESSRQGSATKGRFSKDLENDWAAARREAALNHMLTNWDTISTASKIDCLADDEIDALFTDLRKARALRKERANLKTDQFSLNETESNTSSGLKKAKCSSLSSSDYFIQEQESYTGTGLAIPQDYAQSSSQSPPRLNQLVENDSARERDSMLFKLNEARAEMLSKLEAQRLAYETKIQALNVSETLTPRQAELARKTLQKWKQLKNVYLAELMFQKAFLLKEGQVMAKTVGKQMVFQFTILGQDTIPVSSYDPSNVFEDISANHIPQSLSHRVEALSEKKPVLVIRVMDLDEKVIYLWSIHKFEQRLRHMRGIYQYKDQPRLHRHFKFQDALVERPCPRYTYLGNTFLPLMLNPDETTYETELDLYSPHTTAFIGILKIGISINREGPDEYRVGLGLNINSLHGLNESEVSEVHVQASLVNSQPYLANPQYTTRKVEGFGDGPILLDGRHTFELNVDNFPDVLQFHVFGAVTSGHLEKLLSWDELQESSNINGSISSERTEAESTNEEKHNLGFSARILELDDMGTYVPVTIISTTLLDPGTFFLHQGLSRRIQFDIKHRGEGKLDITALHAIIISNVRTENRRAAVVGNVTSQPVQLNVISPGVLDPSGNLLNIIAQWDSSLHNTPSLDRVTQADLRVVIQVSIQLNISTLNYPVMCQMDLSLGIHGRNQQPSYISWLLSSDRRLTSVLNMFELTTAAHSKNHARDIWSLGTSTKYVCGEENLGMWKPRSFSLIQDFSRMSKNQRNLLQLEQLKAALGPSKLFLKPLTSSFDSSIIAKAQEAAKYWWWRTRLNKEVDLSQQLSCLPALSNHNNPKSRFQIRQIHKSSSVRKCGYLRATIASFRKLIWTKRFYVIRHPYLYSYVDSRQLDEIDILDLTNARTDRGDAFVHDIKKNNVFAIHADGCTLLLEAATEGDMQDWMLQFRR